MLDHEIDVAFATINGLKNPEIHHYQHSTHPGAKWYIKTIIPGPSILTADTKVFLDFWQRMQIGHPYLVSLTDSAFMWSGEKMQNWWTVWLNDRIDIDWNWDASTGIDYRIVEFDTGLKSSGAKLINWLITNWQLDRLTDEQRINYEYLYNIAEFIKTYTSNIQSIKNRANLRVIEHEEI